MLTKQDVQKEINEALDRLKKEEEGAAKKRLSRQIRFLRDVKKIIWVGYGAAKLLEMEAYNKKRINSLEQEFAAIAKTQGYKDLEFKSMRAKFMARNNIANINRQQNLIGYVLRHEVEREEVI